MPLMGIADNKYFLWWFMKKETVVTKELKGKHVLITGSTGFLGKVILEKIVRTQPEIRKITLIVRSNSAQENVVERARKEILDSSVFEYIKNDDPQLFSSQLKKIKIQVGEITKVNFGLDRSTFTELSRDVDVIVNSAASVNFREELDKALQINALCLNNIVDFSESGGNIPIVHVSTCYVHGFHKGFISETLMDGVGKAMPKNADGSNDVNTLIGDLSKKISKVKDKMRGNRREKGKLVSLGLQEAKKYGWNDTYTFTKWIGEQLLSQKLKGKTLIILRPSIIESSYHGPVPGWIEGVKVADAIIFAYARGKLNYFPGNSAGIVDLIPVDMVANGTILSMTKAFRNPGEHHVYQCSSSKSNPLRVGQLRDAIVDEANNRYYKYPKLFRGKRPAKKLSLVNRWAFEIFTYVAKYVFQAQAQITNALRGEGGDDGRLKNLNTVLLLSKTFSFYSNPSYIFGNENILRLSDEIEPSSHKEFPVDSSLINWRHYIGRIHIAGLERYALKEKSNQSTVHRISATDFGVQLKTESGAAA